MRLLDDLQAGLAAIDAAHLRRVRRTAYSPTDRSQRISVSGGEPRDILGFAATIIWAWQRIPPWPRR